MSIKIFVKYFSTDGNHPWMRDAAYWRATAVCLAINDFEAGDPLPDGSAPDAARFGKLLHSISARLHSYGVRKGSRWWQIGRGKWQALTDEPGEWAVRFDGWDKGNAAWMAVFLAHETAPAFEIKREDYGFREDDPWPIHPPPRLQPKRTTFRNIQIALWVIALLLLLHLVM